jgi:hypothetical protein
MCFFGFLVVNILFFFQNYRQIQISLMGSSMCGQKNVTEP